MGWVGCVFWGRKGVSPLLRGVEGARIRPLASWSFRGRPMARVARVNGWREIFGRAVMDSY